MGFEDFVDETKWTDLQIISPARLQGRRYRVIPWTRSSAAIHLGSYLQLRGLTGNTLHGVSCSSTLTKAGPNCGEPYRLPALKALRPVRSESAMSCCRDAAGPLSFVVLIPCPYLRAMVAIYISHIVTFDTSNLGTSAGHQSRWDTVYIDRERIIHEPSMNHPWTIHEPRTEVLWKK